MKTEEIKEKAAVITKLLNDTGVLTDTPTMYYFYEFKHGMHCICKGNTSPVEYLGVKTTEETKAKALKLIEILNKSKMLVILLKSMLFFK